MIEEMSLRQLQTECARALKTISSTNGALSKYNKVAVHNSENWYRAVIQDYIDTWGDLPSKIGPGKDIKLLYDVQV